MKRNSRKEKDLKKAFWERELLANSVRKKDIENLPYIRFDPSMIPLHPEISDVRIDEYISELSSLSGKRILNCTGKSNTDLKLEYGAPNITKLTEYDSNYTILVRSIARLAEKYLIHASKSLQNISSDTSVEGSAPGTELTRAQSEKLRADAISLLEYGISVGTDVRLNYELLAQIYYDRGDMAAIAKLKESAREINSLSREPIIKMLERLEDQSAQ